MIDSRRKYKLQMSIAYPHIGNMLATYINKHFNNISALARQLGVADTTLRKYFENESVQFGILWKLSLVTNHNFIAELGGQLPIEQTSPREEALHLQIKNLQKEIDHLKIELSVYKTIVGK